MSGQKRSNEWQVHDEPTDVKRARSTTHNEESGFGQPWYSGSHDANYEEFMERIDAKFQQCFKIGDADSNQTFKRDVARDLKETENLRGSAEAHSSAEDSLGKLIFDHHYEEVLSEISDYVVNNDFFPNNEGVFSAMSPVVGSTTFTDMEPDKQAELTHATLILLVATVKAAGFDKLFKGVKGALPVPGEDDLDEDGRKAVWMDKIVDMLGDDSISYE
jgi:hypothetical protein